MATPSEPRQQCFSSVWMVDHGRAIRKLLTKLVWAGEVSIPRHISHITYKKVEYILVSIQTCVAVYTGEYTDLCSSIYW